MEKESMKDNVIDVNLQNKYRDTINSVFGINHKQQGYFISPTEEFVTDIATMFLLKDSAAILSGTPGVGKTTILRIIAYLLTGSPEALAVVNCTQDLRAEDFIYEVAIQYREDGQAGSSTPKVTNIAFEPKPRPMLTCTFALVNEVNRLSDRSRNALLSVLAEHSIVVHGKKLNRVTGIVLMDMNPHVAAPLEWAFIDRVRANIQVPALVDLGDQLKLLRTKYGSGRHIEDLVEQVMKTPAPMREHELHRIWTDVDKVKIGDEQFSSIVLFTNVFSSCKLDLSTKWLSYELPCENCEFKENCITTQLEHPVFTRSLDHLVKMLKAQAYVSGRDHVDIKQDMLPALRRAMLHRLQVKAEYASRYVDAQSWYDNEVEQRILILQENWQQAKTSYNEINEKLKTSKDADASKLFNAFRKHVKDVVSLRIVDMLEPTIEAAAEKRFKINYSKLLAHEKTGYSMTMVNEFAQVEQELPPRYADEVKKLRDRLAARLQGLAEVKSESYGDFVVAIAKVDTRASDMASPPSWGQRTYTLSDGSELEVRAEREKYIITYKAVTSTVADAIRQFLTETN